MNGLLDKMKNRRFVRAVSVRLGMRRSREGGHMEAEDNEQKYANGCLIVGRAGQSR